MQHNRPAISQWMPLTIRKSLCHAFGFETPQNRRKRLAAAALNAIAPISTLAPEILCHIFLFCASFHPLRGLGWLAVTHVSLHWWAVAMACTELWANIIFRPKLVPIMLARSGQFPLTIRVNLYKDKHLQPGHIREIIARAGVLNVRGSPDVLTAFFDHVGKTSTPSLTSLSVMNTAVKSPSVPHTAESIPPP
ncbi:hypothetical protein B0H14DRAFT_3703293 [Mycena olivaceomarginata]|nr:hypothetical protein B0H14DRAFT_3703293 [Mycena olivaceomarginata]